MHENGFPASRKIQALFVQFYNRYTYKGTGVQLK